jgi:hypothetical protein
LYHETVAAQHGGNIVQGRLIPRWYRLRDLIADADDDVVL